MQIYRKYRTLPVLLFCTLLASCTGCSLGVIGTNGKELSILSYNVQNLFDDVSNGTEYREFDPSTGAWGTEVFHIKMQHIAEVLRSVRPGGADVVVLVEVENENALAALNDTYLKGLGYSVFAGESGRTAVTVGLLSRLPVREVRAHHLDSPRADQMRDILEAHLDYGSESVVLFANHWKSKLGGAQETESDRILAASFLTRRILALKEEEPAACVVLAGDLNECWNEYDQVDRAYRTALLPAEMHAAGPVRSLFVSGEGERAEISAERVVLYSPWGGAEPGAGSYYYHGGWETIDNLLLGPGFFDGVKLEYGGFAVVRPGFLLSDAGYPLSWNTERESGYSDHLPILLTLIDRG